MQKVHEEILSLLTVEQVRQWLEDFGDEDIVGNTGTTSGNPISNYLRDRGYPEVSIVSVFGGAVFHAGGQDMTTDQPKTVEMVELPKWVADYAFDLDEEAPSQPMRWSGDAEKDYAEYHHRSITAGFALILLNDHVESRSQKKSCQ